jgi:hypothetical protein
LKEIIIVHGAIIFERKPAKQNFKISICFFSLQENPALLVPWMLYVIIFIIANTVFYIIYAAEYFSINDATNGAGNIIAALIYLCK